MALILESEAQSASFHRLRLACAPIARAGRPGQFVHVLPRLPGAGTAYDPLLRRAFSIMGTGRLQETGVDGAGEWFEILFRVGGRGTSLLSRCRAGESLDVLGPLGNGFGVEEWPGGARAEHEKRPLFLVGGGIGVPPLLFVAQRLGLYSGEAEAFVGARTQSELVGVEELGALGVRVHSATDDGSAGRHGVVTVPLRERLRERLEEGQRSGGVGRPLVLACGPWPMLKAVAQVCAEAGAECRVSLEESMPCGVGVCNGCVVPVLGAADDYGRYQRICVHGPVLDSRAVDWGGEQDGAELLPDGPSLPASVDDDMEAPEHQGASQ